MGLAGLIWGGARALGWSRNCSLGFEASCSVNDPSDQRSIRAFDWISSGLLGERLHLMVLFEVLYAEKVEDGASEVW